MKFQIRHFLFLTALVFISTFSFAQKIFIANDFGNCGVGLRDSTSGKWLAEPIYQDIWSCGEGYYKVMLGSKNGILDSTGKIIIPVIYDFIRYEWCKLDSSSTRLFIVTNGDYSGLLDQNNKFIIPLACREIIVATDGSIVASKTKKRFSFYNLKGEEKPIPWKMKHSPIPLGDHLYEVSRNAFGIIYQKRYYHHQKNLRKIYKHQRRFRIKQKYGIINDSLHEIVPKKFKRVNYYPGENKLISVEKRNKNGYYDLHGKQIWAPVFVESYMFQYGFYDHFTNRTALINSSGYTTVKLKKKFGMIGVNGDTLLPFIYDNIYLMNPGGNNSKTLIWFVEKGTKTGIYDPTNKKWILPVQYSRLTNVASYYSPDSSVKTEKTKSVNFINPEYGYVSKPIGLNIMIASKNGKYGMFTTEGQEILPFIYDAYYDYGNGNRNGSYFFRKDSTYISVSIPSYEDTCTSRSYYNSTKKIVSDCPSSHQFEKIEKENGVTLFISSDLVRDSFRLGLYGFHNKSLETNPETYDSLLHATAIIIRPLTETRIFPGIGSVYDYHNPDINYYLSDEKSTFVIDKDTNEYFPFTNISLLATDSFHSYYSLNGLAGVYREDGFLLYRPHKYHQDIYPRGQTNGLTFFLINTGKNKTGFIDGNGKILIDTTWGALEGFSGNYVWAMKKLPRGYRTHYNWNILDTTTHQLLLPEKQCSAETNDIGKNAVLIRREEGFKLYSLTLKKYILTGDVHSIFPTDEAGNYFAVRTCFGKIGIVDGLGNWIADTVWTALINATNNNNFDVRTSDMSSLRPDKFPFDYCVLSNDTGWVIFNSLTGKICHDEETIRLLLKKSENSFTVDPTRAELNKFCSNCPSFGYAEDNKAETVLKPWQENLLFDSLFSGEQFIADSLHSWFVFSCKDCNERNHYQYSQYKWSKNYDQEILNHTIEFINDSCISVSRQNDYYNYQMDKNPSDYFFTVMLFKNGPHKMLLDSLFAGTEWRKVISDEVTLYLESHPEIKGNCHNPAMLSFILNDRFVLTASGITFFPPNFKEGGSQLAVPVPWEKLNPYLRKDVASKIIKN